MARKVTGRDGRTWCVRRRWAPRLGAETVWGRFRRRYRRTIERTGDVADLDPGCMEVLGEGLLIGVGVVVAVLLVVFVGLPVVLALLDLVLVILLALLGLLGRVLLRRPWDDRGHG